MIYVICGIVAIVVFFVIKGKVWNEPQAEIQELKRQIETIQKIHQSELKMLENRLSDSDSIAVQSSEFLDIIAGSAWKQIKELGYQNYCMPQGIQLRNGNSLISSQDPNEGLKKRLAEAIEGQYKYLYLTYLYPELKNVFSGIKVVKSNGDKLDSVEHRMEKIFEIVSILQKNPQKTEELIYWKNRVAFLEASKSNLSAIPYMAEIMSDYETYGIEHLAKELDWGYSIKRMDKVKSIREIRRDAKNIVEKNKEAQYQLAYLLNLFPSLSDVIEAEFNQLPIITVDELSNYDSVRDFLSKEEYSALTVTERNQLALDRYKSSHNRSKWQIGRDYELYVGYKYSMKGFDVDYFGSYMGIEDLGRDLIAKKDGKVFIVQCKYWSTKKQIHENHVNQLYGTMISYCIEHGIDRSKVMGVLVTNIELSPMAKKMADFLGIRFVEHYEAGDYPCIKCNIGKDEYGRISKIYHLPFDQQYDSTKINKKGEFFATTVAEAESAGFRRAFKWFG